MAETRTDPYAAWGKHKRNLLTRTSFRSKAMKERRLVPPDKHFPFAPVIKLGDCQLNKAEVFLVSDGRFYWQAASVQSRGSHGDVWVVYWLNLLDHNGVTLYQVPQFDGPTMDVPNKQYRWLYETYYPAQLYPYVVHLHMDCHC